MKADELRALSKRLATRRYKTVDIEIDGQIVPFRLRNLSALEWRQCTEACKDDVDPNSLAPEFTAMVVAYSLVDDDNEPIFANEAGVVEISAWDGFVVQTLFNAAVEHSIRPKN